MPVRRMIRALVAVLAGAALAVVISPALPAQAGIWHEYPSPANRTCSDSRVYQNVGQCSGVHAGGEGPRGSAR
ncbi:hypothetical protein [Nonomuraea sp. NPDC005650]|uniref:hypothetical protein n=1 Tax=Nonomuraea sp. NPDC005650 TaxID=3157045 RepID=UPI0033AE03B0